MSQPADKNEQQPLPTSPTKPPWQEVLLLGVDETIESNWRGNHAVNEISTVNGRSQEVEMRKPGFLVLTSQKIVFLEERGVFNKSYHLDVGIALESIEGISMGGMWMKYVSVSGPLGENKFHLEGIDANTFEAFRQTILSQVEQRRQEIEKEKVKDSVQLMLDFSFLRDYMEKGGLSLQTLKCPECKAPLPMPQNGNFVKCSYCGSTIYASDIMDTVKKLIG